MRAIAFLRCASSGEACHLLVSDNVSLTRAVMSKIYSGGCVCGSVRFTATTPNNSHSCSCDICRRHTGAPTVVWIEFNAENVEWTGIAGQPATWRSSEISSRAFCPQCGSSVGAIDDAPIIALLAGGFDDPNDESLAPQFHSFSDMMPVWWQKGHGEN